MIAPFASLLLLLIAAAIPAAAQNRAGTPTQSRPLIIPTTPPTVYAVPTPGPLAPPTNPGPAVTPPGGLSPLLSQPGPIFPSPRTEPPYSAPTYPTPLGQQQTQSYRSDLLSQRWQLERQGVSPDNERYRELQQQLNQPSSR